MGVGECVEILHGARNSLVKHSEPSARTDEARPDSYTSGGWIPDVFVKLGLESNRQVVL